jgi:hypothetical protein
MKNTMKKLPFLLAFLVTIFAASCSDIDVEPVHTDPDNEPISIPPPPHGQSATTVAVDSVSIG